MLPVPTRCGRCVCPWSVSPILNLGCGPGCAVSRPVRARRLTPDEGQYLLQLVRRC